jgi:hypothetical protein
MTRRRHVFYLGGYDPIGLRAQHTRLRREVGVFARTWQVSSAIAEHDDHGSWWIWTRGPDWQVETRYEPLVWDDIVLADMRRGPMRRLWQGAGVLLNLVANGTAGRYFARAWRAGLYLLYPYLYVVGFALVAWACGAWLAGYFESAVARFIVEATIGVLVFSVLMRWQGRNRRIQHALDNWIFGLAYLSGRQQDLEQRLDAFAERLIACARAGRADEILVVGHSFGAALAVEVLARALAQDRDLARRGPRIALLTVGSTIPKFTLHPAAGALRERVACVAAERSIFWADVQAWLDVISFYGTDPVSLGPIAPDRTDARPVIRTVSLAELFDLRTMWRRPLRTLWLYPHRLMRLHYQLVLANKRHAAYDYFMLACGPLRFARALSAPNGVLDLMTPDGACRDAAAPETKRPAAEPRAEAIPDLIEA